MPGHGAYVAVADGLTSGGVGPLLVAMESEGPTGAGAPDGVVCYRRVRRLGLGVPAAPALAEYDRVRVPAWAECELARASAWAEYERVRAPALAEYGRARASAWAEYDRVRASAWAELVRTARGEEVGRG